jgi:UDP-N-acetylglucosamine 4,6-dehydratase
MALDLKNSSVMITGGTGSLGKELTRQLLKTDVRRVIIFSRDEVKQQQVRQLFEDDKRLRFFIGDIRDRKRIKLALHKVDYVIHAAALKQVPTCEYNPFEAIKTNILGAQNIVEACLDSGVKKLIALSTDKAANPINLYGATKLCSDKLFVASNIYSGTRTRFSVVRYGNVLASRGSVVPFFLKVRESGVLPITDMEMTRFWLTIEEAAGFVMRMLAIMQGGELFVPKIPSMKIVDLARAIGPECELKVTGIRPGEKLHEVMVPRDEARHTLEYDDFYIIRPTLESDFAFNVCAGGTPVPLDFEFASNLNKYWLSEQQLNEYISHLDKSQLV